MRRTHISDELCRILKEAREAKGLKQTQLAKLLGRTQPFASLYECGQRRLDVGELIEIARHLDLDPVAVVRELDGDR
jgi:transcriptional regulator with XRE-family HTH domain